MIGAAFNITKWDLSRQKDTPMTRNFDEVYNALPVGAEFIAPDGTKRIKQ